MLKIGNALIWLRFGIAALFLFDLGASLYIQAFDDYSYDYATNNKHQSDYKGPIITQIIRPALTVIGRFITDEPEVITALATVVMAIFTWRLWWSTDKLWGEAKAASEIANKTANAAEFQARMSVEIVERSNRPWVGLFPSRVEIIKPLTFDASGVGIEIAFNVKNVGNSPAIGTTLSKNLIVSCQGNPMRYIAQIHEAQIRSGFGRLILPGVVEEWSLAPTSVDRTGFEIGADGNVAVWLSGYIGYLDEFGNPHFSSFLFDYVTSDKRSKFTPDGTITGNFRPIGAGWRST